MTSESPHEIPPSIDAIGAYTDFWQGAGVDRARLSDALAQLPDTADELNAIAKNLGVAAPTFISARTRALLVSHWAVNSEAATRLSISTFDRLKADPKLGRAEALRQAMLAYLNDGSSPRNAYPAFWAAVCTDRGGGCAPIFFDCATQQTFGRARQRRMVAQPRRQTNEKRRSKRLMQINRASLE